MTTVEVNTKKPYKVKICTGLLSEVGTELKALGRAGAVLVVTDSNVAPLYLKTVSESLISNGFEVLEYIIPAGEQSKNTEKLVDLLEFAAYHNLCRDDTFVALGGGVVGDLCGFAASVYMRRTDFIQLPTSLLAMTDSSVGGKCAVDLKHGKNLTGAFFQPLTVLCDTSTLVTLPDDEYINGMGEVIKYGMLNAGFLSALTGGLTDSEIAEYCVGIKAEYVAADEFDRGIRTHLNFGHTVAHAAELCSGYTIPHGKAVGFGMAVITRAAVREGSCPLYVLDTLCSLLSAGGLSSECPYTADEIFAAALKDKKNTHGKITLVMPCGYGKTELMTVPVQKFYLMLQKGIV